MTETKTWFVKIRKEKCDSDDNDKQMYKDENKDEEYVFDEDVFNLINTSLKNKMVLIWRYDDAPDVVQEITACGGDEDYVAFVPFNTHKPLFLDVPHFACCEVSEFYLYADTKKLGTMAKYIDDDKRKDDESLIGKLFVGTHS